MNPAPVEKWGVVEQFRVRAEFRGRVEEESPGCLRRAVAARAALRDAGAHVLGPFRLRWEDGEWWTIAWQFPGREGARKLRALCEDRDWSRFVEWRMTEGEELDPGRGLPGF